MSDLRVKLSYGDLMVGDHMVGEMCGTNCCGVSELSYFQQGNENYWDWYDDLEEKDLKRYGLTGEYIKDRDKIQEAYSKFCEEGAGTTRLTAVCHALATIGTKWKPETAITILALVENWDNAYPIMDALVEGGWTLATPTVRNSNSGNDISLWTYTRKEKA